MIHMDSHRITSNLQLLFSEMAVSFDPNVQPLQWDWMPSLHNFIGD